ncbi:MAG TPA: lytic transglycosylase domain-containing protein [Vicinamibacterales bacterium]|nr:lytic transglycosylase domain-containing protein [Vicinamibacterales bacterium]
MSHRLLATAVRTVVAAGALLSSAVPASAQIYTWRDANGTLVLSNQRPSADTTTRTYAVPKAPEVRATRAVATRRWNAYDDLIAEHSRAQGVRADLVRAVMQVESAFNPLARSPKGALGLMQLMPATIRQFGVRNPFDPSENVRAGVAYLRELLDRYHDNEELALAAYNAGPGAVDKHGESVPPYRETRNYVAQINQIAGRRVEERRTATGIIYKVTETTVDGREIVRYTDRKPADGDFMVVGSR